jgi:hypothetical protein
MIRSTTIASFVLCAALGFGLFKVKYDVQSLEEQLVHVNKQVAADQEAIHVLKAEWSFLTQPARLADLAQRHSPLKPLTAAQLGSFDTLPLKADEPAVARADDVPIENVLRAMHVSEVKLASAGTARTPGIAAAKPRTTP